jgi:hypothetical protein
VLGGAGELHCEQTYFSVVTLYGTEAPQRIIQTVRFQYGDDAEGLVICLSFAEVGQ